MNINQSGSGKPLQKPQLHNPVSAPTRQQQVAGVAYSEEYQEKKLIEIIQSNYIVKPEELNKLVQHKNTKVICEFIQHRGKDLQEHHIDTLIAKNDSGIDRVLVAYPPEKLSDEKGEILLEKTHEYFKL